MKVQIYSPYIILNKTGLPFSLAFKTWSGTQNKVAGQEAFASKSNHSSRVNMTDTSLSSWSTASHKQSHPTPYSKSPTIRMMCASLLILAWCLE